MRRLAAGLLTVLVGSLGATATPVLAATPAKAPTTPELTLVRATPFASPGAPAPFEIEASGVPSGAVLRVEVYARVTSRAAFDSVRGGGRMGGIVDAVEFPFDSLPRTGSRLVVPLQLGASGTSDASRLMVTRTGVYPMVIGVKPARSRLVGKIATWLVVAAGPVREPLRFAWIWQAFAPPLSRSGGAWDPRVLPQFRPGGRMERIGAALHAAAGLPLSVVAGPETLADWASASRADTSLASPATTLRELASEDRQVLPAPYVPLDIPSLAAHGLGGEVPREFAAGADALEAAGAMRPDPSAVLAGSLDPSGLASLRAAVPGRVVVRDSDLARGASRTATYRPFLLVGAGSKTIAAATDESLAALLHGSEPAAARAQQFLAGLAIVALEAPSGARGIIVATPDDFDPDREAVEPVIAGLEASPFVEAVTLAEYFARVPPSSTGENPGERALEARVTRRPPVDASRFRAARAELDAFASLVGSSDPRIARGEAALLRSLTSSWSGARARAELATIDSTARQFTQQVSTEPRTVTITARTAQIPLSFSNKTGRSLKVRVTLASTKLEFPDGPSRVVELPPRNTTRLFTVRARTSGTFAARVTVASVDGNLVVDTASVTVRSAVFGGIGVLLSVSAALLLALWWLLHLLRARRERRIHRAPAAPAPVA